MKAERLAVRDETDEPTALVDWCLVFSGMIRRSSAFVAVVWASDSLEPAIWLVQDRTAEKGWLRKFAIGPAANFGRSTAFLAWVTFVILRAGPLHKRSMQSEFGDAGKRTHYDHCKWRCFPVGQQ
jgi:hypothetical protein